MLLLAMSVLTAHASAATVGGFVYYDANADGKRVTSSTNTNGVEPGLAGVPVAAYGPDGSQLASTTSGPDGGYRLDVPDDVGQVRLEFGSLTALFSARAGEDSRTSVQFVDVLPSPRPNVANFGLHEPAAFCETNPQVAAACIWAREYNGLNKDQIAVRRYGYGERGAYDRSAPGIANVAKFSDVGAVFGMATKQGDLNSIWVSATLKRIAGYGRLGAGGIYRLDGSGGVVPWAAVPNPGTGFARPGSIGNPAWDVDGGAFARVGKESLGGLDIVGDELHVVNLMTRELVTYSATTTPQAAPLRSLPIPNPSCAGGDGDWRPWGVGHFRGELYVGGVCSGQTGGYAGLQAVVLRLRDGTFTPVLRRTLNVRRGYGNIHTPNRHGWNPWRDDFDPSAFDASSGDVYPQPMLTGIQFDGAGSMILGFRDRWGDQMNSVNGPGPLGTGTYNARAVAGDINRACWNAANSVWDWEGTGSCPSNYDLINYHYQQPEDDNQVSPDGRATDEYYPSDYFRFPFGLPLQKVDYGHHETAEGGVVFRPGLPSVMTTVYDPLTDTKTFLKQGVRWLRDDNGTIDYADKEVRVGAGLELQSAQDSLGDNTFGKANGMGDVEVLCGEAPLQIGNRVWFDRNRNGTQDPGAGEPPVPGVEVQLWAQGARIASTTTNDRGEYYFNDVKLGGKLLPSTAYEVRIDTTQAALSAWRLTVPNAAGVRDTIDSDGVPDGTWAIARLTTGRAGQNDHTYDFGFYVVSTEAPTIIKTVTQSQATVGDRFFYDFTVSNTSANPIENAVVVDPIPDIVDPLGVDTTKGTCTLSGRTYRCELGGLAPGESADIRIRVRAARPGRAVNVAVLQPTEERVAARVSVRRSRLNLQKLASRQTVTRGDYVVYRLNLSNVSGTTARRVRICDRIPVGARVTNSFRTQSRPGRRICWRIGALHAGKTVHRAYALRVNRLARGCKPLLNIAAATAQGQPRVRARLAIGRPCVRPQFTG